jgi:DNA modification methylase
MTAEVRHGDCLDVLPTLDAASIDAIVCDPPYGLGFMGKAWDHGVPGAPFWEAALRVAKPGAHLVAFGGTRTFHRLACAIEDAGWEIRDCLSWLYGSGFPKSHNGPWGGTALKPAWEPIILARKPLDGTVAANVAAHGTGALNIDGCRIAGPPSQGGERRGTYLGIMNDDGWQPKPGVIDRSMASGRWPANVVLDEDAAALLDAQSGDVGAASPVRGTEPSAASTGMITGTRARVSGPFHADTGGASRFFYCAKASRAEREAGLDGMPMRRLDRETYDPAYRDAHSGEGRKSETRNHHPTVKPVALMRWLVRLVTPPGGLVLDPFAGSGSTGVAAMREGFPFLGIEREVAYVEIARRRIADAMAQPALEGIA